MDTTFKDPFSEEIWQSTYKHYNDETIDGTFRRVATAIANVEQTAELRDLWGERFYELLSNFRASAGGRILSNAGAGWKGTTLLNCFVGPIPEKNLDSLDGILKVLRDQAFTLKSEGGWGMNFSFIRPRGSFIAGIGVHSPGSVKYMELFDKASDIITAGSATENKNKKSKGKIRKGAQLALLDCTHPDIIEYVTAKQSAGRLSKFNMSVNFTNEFMDKIVKLETISDKESAEYKEIDIWNLEFPETSYGKYNTEWDGDLASWKSKGYPVKIHKTISASFLWNLVMESTYNRAEPGVLFLDRANHLNPLYYNGKIRGSNPCCAKGTLVSTPFGLKKIEEINIGDEISTVRGSEPVDEIETHKNLPVFKITFSDGGEEIVTAAHRYHAFKKDETTKCATDIPVKELKVGDRVRLHPTPLKNEGTPSDYLKGVRKGILLGDGCYTPDRQSKGSIKIASNQDDVAYNANVKDVFQKDNFAIFGEDDLSKKSRSMNLMILNGPYVTEALQMIPKKSHEKYFDITKVATTSEAVGLLDGLLATDGNVNLSSNHAQLRIMTSSPQLATSIRQLFFMIGCSASLTNSFNDDGGVIDGRKIERKHRRFVVNVSGASLGSFIEKTQIQNLHPQKWDKLQQIMDKWMLTGNTWKATIRSIEPFGTADVYDLYCKGSDTWITSGYVQRGCGEQLLTHGGVCNLGSLNLTQFVEEDQTFNFELLKKYTGYMIRFLDDIIDIANAPLSAYEQNLKARRRVGCGIMGWGSTLYMLKIKFSSKEANSLAERIMKTISHTAVKTSIELAKEKGMFTLCDPEKHSKSPYFTQIGLDEDVIADIKKYGMRNSSLMSIQPTGNTGILANVVSGGMEPVFAQEYTRTVIVNEIPSHLKEVTPKYWEGVLEETEAFKWTTEGDDRILAYTDEDGVRYKIDENRGLTKEVQCQDYGVRWLSERGQWDKDAEWAVATNELSAEDHINDLKIFAKYLDSSASKTVNLPNDYPLESFKNVYLDAYNTGVIKGLTTYRSGTMVSVLSAKECTEENCDEEEVILEDVKLPDNNPAVMKILRAEGKKWYLTIVKNVDSDEPVAFFAHTNSHERTSSTALAIDELLELAEVKGIPKEHIDILKGKISGDNNVAKICRTISLNLRHGVKIRNIVLALERAESVVGSFVFAIKKFLSTYIKDGEKAETKCPNCKGDTVIFEEGCTKCISCGNSKC